MVSPRTLSCGLNATCPSRAISSTSTATCLLMTSRSVNRSYFSQSLLSSIFFLPFFPLPTFSHACHVSGPVLSPGYKEGSSLVPDLSDVAAICCHLLRMSLPQVPQKQCDVTQAPQPETLEIISLSISLSHSTSNPSPKPIQPYLINMHSSHCHCLLPSHCHCHG